MKQIIASSSLFEFVNYFHALRLTPRRTETSQLNITFLASMISISNTFFYFQDSSMYQFSSGHGPTSGRGQLWFSITS